MDAVSGITSLNTRASTIKRFLSKPPDGAVKLTATLVAEPPLLLEEWPIATVRPEPGIIDEIQQLLDESAREEGGHVTLLLAYVDESGAQVGSVRKLKRQSNHLEGPSSIATDLDGSLTSQAKQAQQTLEFHTRLYLTAHASQLNMLMQQLEHANGLVLAAERRAQKAESDALRVRTEVVQAMQEAMERGAGEQSDEGPSPAQERAFKLLEQLAPIILHRLLGAGAVAAPAQPTP